MKVIYVALASLPSSRAQSVHVAKMADALYQLGRLETLVLPWAGASRKEIQNSYSIADIPIAFLPSVDLLNFVFSRGVRSPVLLSFLFRIRALSFAISSSIYLALKKRQICWVREPGIALVGSLLGHTTVLEIHAEAAFPNILRNASMTVADLCVALTPSLARIVAKVNANVLVEGDCVDLHEFEVTQPVQLGEGEHIVYVGSLSQEKGVYDLLNAWKEIGLADAHLWLIGDGEAQHIRRITEANGLRNVHITGPLPHREAIRYFKAATVVVVPTRETPFFLYSSPMKLFEAAACQKAIVASDIEGNRQLIENAVTGLIFRAADFQQLGHAIRKLLQDQALREKTAKMAYEEVRYQTWINRAKRILDIIAFRYS